MHSIDLKHVFLLPYNVVKKKLLGKDNSCGTCSSISVSKDSKDSQAAPILWSIY